MHGRQSKENKNPKNVLMGRERYIRYIKL